MVLFSKKITLVTAYFLTALVISGVLIFSVLSVRTLLGEQQAYAELINLAGKQRMLSQKIVSNALLTAKYPSINLDQENAVLIEQMRVAVEYIEASVDRQELYKEQVLAVQVLSGLAYQFEKTPDQATIKELLQQREDLIESLDNVVTILQQSSEGLSQRIIYYAYVFLIIILSIILVMTFVVFMPLYRKFQKNHGEVVSLSNQLQQTNTDLERLIVLRSNELDKLHEESEIAKRMHDRILESAKINLRSIQTLLLSASKFSGDVYLVARSPSGNVHVMLGDVTGHGLKAAIVGMLAAETFYHAVENDVSPGELLQQLNTKLVDRLPVSIFMAAQYYYLGSDNKRKIYNCGMQDILVLDRSCKVIQRLPSQSIALGIISDMVFSALAEDCLYEDNCLVFHSDGLIEAHDASDNIFGIDRMIQVIESVSDAKSMFTLLKARLFQHIGGKEKELDDDVSLVKIDQKSLYNEVILSGKIFWKPEYSVGNDEIDAQHRRILHLINRLYEANEQNDSVLLQRIFDSVSKYAIEHLNYEEHLLKAVAYPDFDDHMRQHDDYRSRIVNDMKAMSESGDIENIIIYLENWWVNHILKDDMQYKAYMK